MKKILIIVSVIICVFYAFWLEGVPRFLGLTKPFVYSSIEQLLGYKISDTDLIFNTSLRPDIVIKADTLRIVNPNDDEILNIAQPFVRINLLPLLWGKVKITALEMKDLKGECYLDEPILKQKTVINFLKKISFNSSLISVEKYRINLAQKHGEKGVLLDGNGFYYSKNTRGRKLKTSVKANINGKSSDICFDVFIPKSNKDSISSNVIKVENFALGYLNKYFSEYLPKDLVSITGSVNFDLRGEVFNADLSDVKISFKESFKDIEFPVRTFMSGKINFFEQGLNLKELVIKGAGLDAKFDYAQRRFGTRKLDIKTSVEIINSRTEVLIKFLPAIHTQELNLYYLKKYPLYGDVNGRLGIDSKASTSLFTGNILVNNAYLVNPIKNDKKRASINLSFDGDKVKYDVIVGAGGSELVQVNGMTDLYGDRDSKIKIKSSQNVDLSIARDIVEMLRKILYFEAGPLPILKISGRGNIDIDVEGNRQNPHVWGALNFKNATASFVEMNGIEISSADGRLDFNDQNVLFKFDKALIEGKPVSINGTCDLFGHLKVFVETENFDLSQGLSVIKTSPMLQGLRSIIPPVDNVQGLADLKLEITGVVPDVEDVVLSKNLFVKGSLNLHKVAVTVQEFVVSNIFGKIDFENKNVVISAKSRLENSSIDISGKITDDIADFHVSSDKLDLRDILYKSAFKGVADGNIINFDCKYKGKADVVEYDKILLKALVLQSGENIPLVLSQGDITVKNGVCHINNIKGFVTNNPFVMSAKIVNLGKKTQNINASIKLSDAALSTINLIREFYLIPQETKNLLRQFDFEKGVTNIDLKVVNNRPYMDFELDDVLIKYLPLDMPLKIINGRVELKNDLVNLSKINTLADDMPIFIDGKISNIYKTPFAEVYINSVPKQTFIDKYINRNSLYPLKVKGDIIYSTRLKGRQDLYNITANAKIGERASVYYMGASLGDMENPTIIDVDADIVKNNAIKINKFEYNKSVLSQNNKPNIINFLKVNGLIRIINNEPVFNNLQIKTENATDARIFNVIFKKPHIKQGLFNSDLRINGKLSNLKISGDFNIYDIDVPLMQTILKSVSLKFLPQVIKIDSIAEFFSNEIKLSAEAENKLYPPFRIKKGNVHFDKLDMNSAIADLKKIELNKPKQYSDKQEVNLAILEIDSLNLTAEDVLIKGVFAKGLETIISLSDKMLLSFSDYSFDLANGKIAGDFSYNLLTNRADLLMNAENIDANELSEMLFDLSNQMYGALTGTVNLSCNGTNSKTCMTTLNGNAVFNVSDGRMPKLGSLEYLLKAGNLLKGGITGLSINSLVDLITPLKTGEFSNIFGNINISQGVADDIKISTRGKDLSLYMKGSYNFDTSDARMYVFGLLSRNIKTPLGAIGNVSLNTLFNLIPGVDLEAESPFVNDLNKIPGLELSQKSFRKFIAEILGDITGENYVKSFKWVN